MSDGGRFGGSRRPVPAVVGVAVVFGAAGLLFATSAATAHGTQLRADRTDLVTLIRSENTKHDAEERRLAQLHAQVEALTSAAAGDDSQVAQLRRQAQGTSLAAGLTPVSGHGLVVALNDAPVGGPGQAGAAPDDLVVHQQDVQAVVNALWAGGAEAMMLMDQRVISTSAVRCVGNTLILQGRLYSPPYRISAIGDPARLRAAMAADPTIPTYLEYSRRFGLGWTVDETDLAMPAFTGSVELRYAVVPATPTPSPSQTPSPSLTPSPAASADGASPAVTP